MRSLHTAILVAMLAILALSYLVFRSISDQMEKAYFDPVFDKMDQLEDSWRDRRWARVAHTALSTYMQRLDSLFGGRHYLLDEQGVDMVTGANHAGLLAAKTTGFQFPRTTAEPDSWLPTARTTANIGLLLGLRSTDRAHGCSFLITCWSRA